MTDPRPIVDIVIDWMRLHDEATVFIFAFLCWMWLSSFLYGMRGNK